MIVNYLNIDSVKNINFPYGEKYRLDKKETKRKFL